MGRPRNAFGQFIKYDSNESLFIHMPGPFRLFNYFIIFLVISPWLFVLFYRIDIESNFKSIIEFIFGIKEEQTKASSFFNI